MPRRCTVCGHKNRPAIDKALVARQPFRTIADQFSVSKTALLRHYDDHLPSSLVKAQEATEAAQADALLAQVVDLRDKALGVLEKAEAADELRAAVSAIREARGCVELLGKLAGQLKDAPTINLVLSDLDAALNVVEYQLKAARIVLWPRAIVLDRLDPHTSFLIAS